MLAKLAALARGGEHGTENGVSADTALRFARYFGTTSQLWLNLRKTWELRQAEIVVGRETLTPQQSAA